LDKTVVSFYETDPFREEKSRQVTTLSICIRNMGARPPSMEEFTAYRLQDMRNLMDDVSEMRLSDVKLCNIEGKKIEYTRKFGTDGTPVKFNQSWVLKDTKAYIFTFSTLGAYFESNIPIMERCFSSFTIIKQIPDGTLQKDIATLFNNQELSDVTFIVEGKAIYGNRSILAARCQHFKAMLFGGLKESRSDQIVIPDVTHKVFMAMMSFLYLDEVNVSIDIAFQLLMLADSYMLERLKTKCEYIIQDSVTIENVCALLVGATTYRADQ